MQHYFLEVLKIEATASGLGEKKFYFIIIIFLRK